MRADFSKKGFSCFGVLGAAESHLQGSLLPMHGQQ